VAGFAAYYSRRCEGRRTTSGERYRAEKLTAAHPDAPLGTLLRVVHADSGKEVVVRVNDRCRKKAVPFVDLSRAAARELGFLGKGKARVRIATVGEAPGPAVAKEAALP
jgi:rare lipoprotein A